MAMSCSSFLIVSSGLSASAWCRCGPMPVTPRIDLVDRAVRAAGACSAGGRSGKFGVLAEDHERGPADDVAPGLALVVAP